jgi:hypothetical protein
VHGFLLRGAITAPKGKSARCASSIAMRMKRSSSAFEGCAACAPDATAMQASPGQHEAAGRTATGAIRTRGLQMKHARSSPWPAEMAGESDPRLSFSVSDPWSI